MGYVIYQGTTIASMSSYKYVDNVTSYRDQDVMNGVTYFYKVSARNWVYEGNLTDLVSATPGEKSTWTTTTSILAIVAMVAVVAIVAISALAFRKTGKSG